MSTAGNNPLNSGGGSMKKNVLHVEMQLIPLKLIMQGKEVKTARDPFPFKMKVSVP